MSKFFQSWYWRYRGCFVPPLAVFLAFIVIVILAKLLGQQNIPKLTFTALVGFPQKLDIKNTFMIGKLALWWILAIYLLWLTAIIGGVTTLFISNSTLKDIPARTKRIGFLNMGGVVVIMVVILRVLATNGAPSYSGSDLFHHLAKLATGFDTLIELSNDLTIVVLVLIILNSGFILMPVQGHFNYIRRMKGLNGLLFIGAIVTVVWVFYARILYGFAAVTLVPNQNTVVDSIAPSLSLVTGGIASIYLVIMYFSAFLWLQSQYASSSEIDQAPQANNKDEVTSESPKSILFSLWPRVFMLTTPLLPGLFEFLFQIFQKI